MWTLFRRAENQVVGEMWKELLESEGVPMRILPDPEDSHVGLTARWMVYMPMGKEHVVEEIMRKLSWN